MQFTSIPQNFASYLHPLIYEFADDGAPRTLDLFVRDGLTGDTIAVKRLCNTSAGKVDIAPILRSRLTVAPLSAPGFASAFARALCIRTTVEEASETRWFLPAETVPGSSPLSSTLPAERPIGFGECDELTLGPNISRAELEVETPAGMQKKVFFNLAAEQPSLFRLDTAEAAADFTQLLLSFCDRDGNTCRQVRYIRTPRPEEAVRVAWFSRLGSLEHYTFPVRNRLAERQEGESLRLCDGRRIRIRASHGTLLTLTSAYERREILQALCEIGTSRAVWVATPDGRYLEADAKAGERTIAEHGALSALTFTFEIAEPWS